MAAMLVYKNNRFSLRWELISIVHKFCTFCTILYTNMAALSREWKPSINQRIYLTCRWYLAEGRGDTKTNKLQLIEYIENNGMSAVRPLTDHNNNIGHILIFLTTLIPAIFL